MRLLCLAAACCAVPARCAIIIDITDPPFSCKGDNRTINTVSIQRAIDTVSMEGGGGRVLIPPRRGSFLSGAIFLRSNIELHIGAGSTLQAVAPTAWLGGARSTAQENASTWTHFPRVYTPDLQQDVGGYQHAALINGGFCEQVSTTPEAYGDQCLRWRKLVNVTVSGEGAAGSVVDGGGWLWWKMCGYRTGLHGDGKGVCPDGAAVASQRPKLMHFLHTDRLSVRGLWARNSAFFHIVPQCKCSSRPFNFRKSSKGSCAQMATTSTCATSGSRPQPRRSPGRAPIGSGRATTPTA